MIVLYNDFIDLLFVQKKTISINNYKLLRSVKSDPKVKGATSIDGKIICYLDDPSTPGKDKKIVITNPDELIKLGWSEKKIQDAGLHLDLEVD